MKKVLSLILAVMFIATIASADEMKKISTQDRDYVEYKETLNTKDIKGVAVEIYIGEPILYNQRVIDRIRTEAERHKAEAQAVLDKLDLVQTELEKVVE